MFTQVGHLKAFPGMLPHCYLIATVYIDMLKCEVGHALMLCNCYDARVTVWTLPEHASTLDY